MHEYDEAVLKCFLEKQLQLLPEKVADNIDEAEAFLEEQYGQAEANRLLEEIIAYSHIIPSAIEERHGRLIELGLDYGIDRDKRLWLLEANSKPGRSVFNQTGDREASTLAVEMPILYARHVGVRHHRRVCP